MAKDRKNKWAGIVIGPLLVFFSCAALWKNETRFDYHKAAARTPELQSLDAAKNDENFSFTGPMDQELTYPGDYINEFKGKLIVYRSAEIYAWDRRKDDDSVTWRLKWMSSVERNSRNSGVRQRLSSKNLTPPRFDVGELRVAGDMIEFVDSSEPIDVNQLTLSESAVSMKLHPAGEHLLLKKGKPQGLGDERVSYSGIPVPAKATYFGKYSSSDPAGGVADTSQQRTSWVNKMIQDTGILHHLVAGDRVTALATMKAYIAKVKWIIRGIGTTVVVIGFVIFFSTIVGFLFQIPIIGSIAEAGSFILALALGLPLAAMIMTAGYFFAHPFILVALIASVVGVIMFFRQRGKATQTMLRGQVQQQYGAELDTTDFKELEFMELAQLAFSDAEFGDKEKDFLRRWAMKHGWDGDKYSQMLRRAQEKRDANEVLIPTDAHLANLIRLSLADGQLSAYEIRAIREAASSIGYDKETVDQMIKGVRSGSLT